MNKLKLTVVSLLLSAVGLQAMAAEVNVYSARKEALIKPVLDKFTAKTGIKVNLVTGKADALISRLASEGRLSKADVLLTTDAGRLVRAKQQGLTQPFSSGIVKGVVPENLRDPQGHWFALTLRARPMMYAPDRVEPEELSTLDALTDSKWKGRICIRSSSNIYNQSMLAAMIEQRGEQVTQSWANGLVQNFARPPRGGDRDQIKAVVAGQCDIAIANTYYLAGMLSGTDKEAREVASQVKVFWPDQAEYGAHVNISGAAMTRHAPNTDEAGALLNYLLTGESQAWYAETNGEYPVLKNVDWSETLKGFGQFKAQEIPLNRVGELNADAVRVMDKAGWK